MLQENKSDAEIRQRLLEAHKERIKPDFDMKNELGYLPYWKKYRMQLKEEPERYEKYKERERLKSNQWYLKLKEDPEQYASKLKKEREKAAAKRLKLAGDGCKHNTLEAI